MGKKPKPFITRIQAEGTPTEKLLEKETLHKEAMKLADKMPTHPTDRQMYVLNLFTKALQGKIDKEVFKEFVRITNSYMEVEAIASRGELLTKRRKYERDKV